MAQLKPIHFPIWSFAYQQKVETGPLGGRQQVTVIRSKAPSCHRKHQVATSELNNWTSVKLAEFIPVKMTLDVSISDLKVPLCGSQECMLFIISISREIPGVL